ncbi:MAG: type II toxin-antitoxin system RatA family toxin, partial [Gammaproteobacteria bacterium]
FSELQGVWRFVDIDDQGSRVQLDLDFELSSRMLKMALESFFSQICDRLVSSFVQRANDVYQ